jgi:hypothetical protein
VITAHGPLFTKPRRRLIRFWAVLAGLNLGVGIVLALQPSRATDLESVMGWGRQWLLDGVNVYALQDSFVDYPPHAVVMLSPLGLLPFGAALPFWVLVNLALAFFAPYMAARFFQPHAPFRIIVPPILMFLSWWGTHTLTQFSLLALALSMAALFLSDGKPLASGMCLGLALMKPQVALPVLCWTLFTRRWRMAATALSVVALGLAIFCARAHAGPASVIERYLAILAMYHTGDAILSGASELRPLIHAVVSDVSQVDLISGAIALGLIAGICVAGFQEGRSRSRALYTAPPLVACWALLTFYHLSYGFVVLLPVMMLLFFNDADQAPLRKALFWTVQIGMMIDVPGVIRRSAFPAVPVASALLAHADRFLILLILTGLVALAWRESAAGAG